MPNPPVAWRAALVDGSVLRVWDVQGVHVSQVREVTPAAHSDPQVQIDDAFSVMRPCVLSGTGEPVRDVPCTPLDNVNRKNDVIIVPSLRQAAPPVQSHGAETAIAGYLSNHPKFDGVILTIGQQSLWSHISAGEVVSMMAFETPRLAVTFGAAHIPGSDFDESLSDTLARPERIAAHLAQTREARTRQELAHLIGAELAAARPYWLGQFVTVLADDGFATAYADSLKAQGAMVGRASFGDAFIAGCLQALEL